MGERFRPESFGVKQGHFYEAAVLGSVRSATLGQFSRYIETNAQGRHAMPYEQGFAEVEQSQPWDPTAPGKPFLEDFRFELLDQQGIEDSRSPEVRAYTAVGSDLDHAGIDAYFRVGDDIVTIDLTLRQDAGKLDTPMADLIITEEMPAPVSEEYLPWVQRWATEAQKCLERGTRYKQGYYGGEFTWYSSPEGR